MFGNFWFVAVWTILIAVAVAFVYILARNEFLYQREKRKLQQGVWRK